MTDIFDRLMPPEVAEDTKAEAGDQILYAVTSVLSVLDKPALIPWAVDETAKWVVKLHGALRTRIEQEGEEAAREWVNKLRWRTDGKLAAKDLGSLMHGYFEEMALTGTRPVVSPEDHPLPGKELSAEDIWTANRMLDQFEAFLSEFRPEYLATEVVVFHPEMGYAGTLDGIVVIDGQRLFMDYKTSRETFTKAGKLRGPYPEVGLQIAAYRHATLAAVWRARRTKMYGRRYYLLSPEEKANAVPTPEADGGVAVYITPDRFGVYPVRCGQEEYEAFLFVMEVARWQFNWASQMVGNPMVAPFPTPNDPDPFRGLPQ